VVRFALEGTLSASNPVAAAPATAPRWSRILPWAVSALAVAISIWSPWTRASSEPAPVVYAAIDAPDGFVLGEDDSVAGLPSRTPVVFTPDGRGLIVLATRPVEPGAKIPQGGPRSRLFFRSLDRPDMGLIAGTEGARMPFVSPDGKWIGFWASNELRKVPIDGGAPTTICPLVTAFLGPFGAAWGPDDTIVFGDVPSGRIMRVSANGGTPIAVTTPPSVAGRRRHIAPVFLPDGKRILFTDTSTQDAADARIMQQPLEGGAATLVIDKAADGRLLASGQLAFIRLATLMTVPFDSGRAMVQGEPAAVMNNVMQGAMIRQGAVTHPGMAMFAVSSQGTLAALRGGLATVSENLLCWTDPRGLSSAEPAHGAPKGARMNTRISPDRSRALVTVLTPRRTEMWLADWTRNVWNPCESCDTDLGAAEWSPDGRRLLLGRDGTRSRARRIRARSRARPRAGSRRLARRVARRRTHRLHVVAQSRGVRSSPADARRDVGAGGDAAWLWPGSGYLTRRTVAGLQPMDRQRKRRDAEGRRRAGLPRTWGETASLRPFAGFAGFASPPRLSTQQSHRRGVHEQGFAMFAGKLLL
jgi:hypothetical protein